LILAPGCSTTKQISSDDKEKISALVMPKIDNMMQGYAKNDYQQFSADFSPKLREGMPLSGFNDTRKMLSEKIGNYQSFEIADIMETQNFITVVCDAVFDNDGKVTIRVVFDPKDNYSVAGIWFDSPELRK
jgi:hypothetical protein